MVSDDSAIDDTFFVCFQQLIRLVNVPLIIYFVSVNFRIQIDTTTYWDKNLTKLNYIQDTKDIK